MTNLTPSREELERLMAELREYLKDLGEQKRERARAKLEEIWRKIQEHLPS